MGRHPIKEELVKHSVFISIEKRIIDTIDRRIIKDIAENAVIKEYKKILKTK